MRQTARQTSKDCPTVAKQAYICGCSAEREARAGWRSIKHEIEELVPDYPYAEAFWAFLILSCHNRRDIPRDVLHGSLFNDDSNEDVDYDRGPADLSSSFIPVDCFGGIYCNFE